jgi:hypothetical protein
MRLICYAEESCLHVKYQKPSYADRYKPWPMPFYQAALLNIIFAFYFGASHSAPSNGVAHKFLRKKFFYLGQGFYAVF